MMAVMMSLIISLTEPSRLLNQQKAGHRLSKIESLMGISICGV